uniref:Uncharacterized protein n=1 Tax=Rhizophora mucronata TaxID=61149 RepID=A0A2P2QRK9_RHIMU
MQSGEFSFFLCLLGLENPIGLCTSIGLLIARTVISNLFTGKENVLFGPISR